MKRWVLIVVLLYTAVIILFTLPVITIAFIGHETRWLIPIKSLLESIGQIFGAWQYWMGLLVLMASQFVLLLVPARVSVERPVSKRFILFPVITGAILFGLLTAGLALCVFQTFPTWSSLSLLVTAGFLVSWIIWAVIFRQWSRKMDPRSLNSRICRTLFYGSILQLLIAVPVHIISRMRDECCAGIFTFLGLTFGIAVMLVSFGPAVYFLFVERWKRLHPGKGE